MPKPGDTLICMSGPKKMEKMLYNQLEEVGFKKDHDIFKF